MSMKSRQNLYAFVHDWNFETNGAGFFYFHALVAVEAPKKRLRAETEVTAMVAGYHDGVIGLREAGGLTRRNCHLEFKADFQDYTYDEEAGVLFVRGNSPLLGEAYQIEIVPLGYQRS